ncbi:TonB-dependent receptor plug domain-containing protein [Marinibactrum halimedae]|uniref:TonB-dependent receptor n=1 Tax=Marinibactrum halimedae TaxID=1444977 RepID=A0AA37WP67_9GAMM|nr:TonB-dependent receptor [Marinibactrum halimedae]MCD9458940.1 TonB-dependent receptor [Marinibactrum halimedae]GLS26931.1 TonB-dependent receptor [Marinibactrum halimedae]
MFKKSHIAVAVAATLGTASLGMSSTVFAQKEQLVEEIVVTGSAIPRKDLDGALPVQTFSELQIKQSGVTNAADLVADMPAMQNMVTASDSVGGTGGGVRTADLRSIGSQYTLSLMNGRRIASYGSGSSIDISNIPLSAVERVEVLTDGASALYGSDAIAGVLNFILKDEVDETTIVARMDSPEESGGEKQNLSITTGFGNFDSDGFSAVFSYSHESQEQLAATDRDFARTGIVPMGSNEEGDLYFFRGSVNSIPGNARVRYNDANGEQQERIFNPYATENGSCPEQTFPLGTQCAFDFTSTIEIIPETERDNFFASGKLRITDEMTAFATASYGKNEMIARIAPYPTGYVPLPVDSDVVVSEILPHLTEEERAGLTQVHGRWRALPAENRTTEYITESLSLVSGVRGTFDDVNYEAALNYSESNQEQNYPTGWLYRESFVDLVSSGGVNIFAGQEDFSDEDRAALSDVVYRGNWDNTEVSQIGFDARASKPMFEISGGEVFAAVGMDYRSTNYLREVASANANEELLFLDRDTPYELNREQYGVFTEVVVPVLDNVEVTASLRYDVLGAVKDENNGRTVNDTEGDYTYKVTTRWDATDTLSLRASVGTGFKAPSMLQIGEPPRTPFGVTSASWECPFEAGDELAQYCLTGRTQYGVFREGNEDLDPERSQQFSAGFVYTPNADFSMTVDYWKLELEDTVEYLTQAQIFNNPDVYRHLFTSRTNLATGEEELAIIQQAVNVGEREASGVDYQFEYVQDFGELQLTSRLNGTYFIESESSLTGSSLGRFGDDNDVVFRNKARLSFTAEHGNFTHVVGMSYQSGYTDALASLTLIRPDGSSGSGGDAQLEVPSYTLLDYQTSYSFADLGLDLTFGINNLADEEPPLSLRNGGAGHQVGWDPRYNDAYGRTFYLQAQYSF